MAKKVEETKKELQKKIDALAKLEAFADGELSKTLTTVSFEEMPQVKYDQKVIEAQKNELF